MHGGQAVGFFNIHCQSSSPFCSPLLPLDTFDIRRYRPPVLVSSFCVTIQGYTMRAVHDQSQVFGFSGLKDFRHRPDGDH